MSNIKRLTSLSFIYERDGNTSNNRIVNKIYPYQFENIKSNCFGVEVCRSKNHIYYFDYIYRLNEELLKNEIMFVINVVSFDYNLIKNFEYGYFVIGSDIANFYSMLFNIPNAFEHYESPLDIRNDFYHLIYNENHSREALINILMDPDFLFIQYFSPRDIISGAKLFKHLQSLFLSEISDLMFNKILNELYEGTCGLHRTDKLTFSYYKRIGEE